MMSEIEVWQMHQGLVKGECAMRGILSLMMQRVASGHNHLTRGVIIEYYIIR